MFVGWHGFRSFYLPVQILLPLGADFDDGKVNGWLQEKVSFHVQLGVLGLSQGEFPGESF